MSRPRPEALGDKSALCVLWSPLDVDSDPLVLVDLSSDFVFVERLVLVIRGELDRVCHEPGDKQYVVGCFERSMRLFDSLVHRKRNHDQNQVLNDCFGEQDWYCEHADWLKKPYR